MPTRRCQASAYPLCKGSQLASYGTSGAHQALKYELRNEFDDGHGAGGNCLAEQRSCVAPADALEESDEGIDCLEDAA
ncbi:MAG TPA: hypothetical protein VEO53_16965 [Candidatus Binatia bacterium]|nr:hypothetical protein [Candidatus Binatia bacterium]